MAIIIFLIILAVLIFVHELGHFIVAKRSGIRVDEFAIGFPPKLFSWQKGETRYVLNLIPFGGYVKIFGENPDEESIAGPDSPRSFVNKPKTTQIAVLIAGIVFNILFAWLLISVGFMTGLPSAADSTSSTQVENPRLVITSVAPSSPAERAGILPGDEIQSLKTADQSLTTLTPEGVQDFISSAQEKEITATLVRDNETKTISLRAKEGIVSDRPAVGISMGLIGTVKLPPHKALYEGAKFTATMTKAIAKGLGTLIGQAFTGKAQFSQITGPVGIVGLVGDASHFGFAYLLSFTAFISINLAVINLIPFPALDGGRILFVLIEAIKGSPIRPKVANTFNLVGFALLMLLMIVVTFHDMLNSFYK